MTDVLRDYLLAWAASAYTVLDRRRQVLVLTLHRVGGPAELGAAGLRQHLTYLAERYRMVTPTQLPTVANEPRVALVTIDDCHHDVVDVIFPTAHALGVPITVCAPTDFLLRNRWLWFDRLNWALARGTRGQIVDVGNVQLKVGDAASRARLLRHLKRQTPAGRDSLIERVLEQVGVAVPGEPTPEYQPTTPEQMRAMLASGLVELCAHTVTHPIMTHVSDEQLRRELEQSKRELEEFSGRTVVSFCYPNGEPGDFDARTRRGLQDAGYRVAFTSIEGLNRPGSVDWLELKRLHAHPRFSVFRKLASGLGDVQRGLRAKRAAPVADGPAADAAVADAAVARAR